MSYVTRAQAVDSLREFSPQLRKLHLIVSFYSERHGCTRYARALIGVSPRVGG